MKTENLKLLKEKYKIALLINDFDRAKKFLLEIRVLENEERIKKLEKPFKEKIKEVKNKLKKGGNY